MKIKFQSLSKKKKKKKLFYNHSVLGTKLNNIARTCQSLSLTTELIDEYAHLAVIGLFLSVTY